MNYNKKYNIFKFFLNLITLYEKEKNKIYSNNFISFITFKFSF